MSVRKKNPKGAGKISFEFPVLVYHSDDGWVALSLLTSTVAVAADPQQAANDVAELLCGELSDAFAEAPRDPKRAFDSMVCAAENHFWAMYFQAQPMTVGVADCDMPVPAVVSPRETALTPMCT